MVVIMFGVLTLITSMFFLPALIISALCPLLKRRTPGNRELQGLQGDLEVIRAEVREIKDQIADFVVGTYQSVGYRR